MLFLFIFGILLIGLSIFLIVVRTRKIAKALSLELVNLKREFYILMALAIINGIGIAIFTLGFPGVFKDPTFFNWGDGLSTAEYFLTIIGGILFGFTLSIQYISFRIHYYQKGIPLKLDKWLYRIMIIGIFVAIGAFWILSEGVAKHIVYPLINGISFNGGFHFVTAKSSDKANLAWYALCILIGAVICYFIADHMMYRRFNKHGLLESTFLVAFPAGIIGARLFYVIGNWNVDFAGKPFWHVFAIWEGGLTILGGAIFGIVVGVLWFKWRHPKTDVFTTVDFCAASILFAQAIGRWGNFFNCEVHGNAISNGFFNILPTFIKEQSRFSQVSATLESGYMYVPLFLIEGIVNLLGFYLLDFVALRHLPKDTHKPGDNFGLYMIWYGLTRTFMEPLRASSYNMGTNGKWSWIWSILFITIGLLFILGNHITRYYIDRKKHNLKVNGQMYKHSTISLIVLSILGGSLFISGLTMMLTSNVPAGSSIQYCTHNIGIVLMIIGASLIPLIAYPIIRMHSYKNKDKQLELNQEIKEGN